MCNSASVIWCSIKFDLDRQTDTSSLFTELTSRSGAAPSLDAELVIVCRVGSSGFGGNALTPGQMVASLMIADPSQAAQSSIVELDVPFFSLYSASVIWCSIKFDRDGRTDRQTDSYVIF